jgi:hypothetical protein
VLLPCYYSLYSLYHVYHSNQIYRFAAKLLQVYCKTPAKALQALQALQRYKDFLRNPEFADVVILDFICRRYSL